MPWSSVALVALGGAIGAGLRFMLVHMVQVFSLAHVLPFPIAILIANVSGAFLIGVCFECLKHLSIAWLKPLLVTGVLGGFTTFSTFSLDTVLHMQKGEYLFALLNVCSNVVLCLFACFLGMWCAQRFC